MQRPDPSRTLGVLLADDHDMLLWGLVRMVDAMRPRMACVGTCNDAARLSGLARELKPDVVVLDLDFGGVSGIDLIPELAGEQRATVLVLTGADDPDVLCDAVVAGARGVLHKSQPGEVLGKAIEAVAAGELWVGRDLIGRVMDRLTDPDALPQPELDPVAVLTSRERQIVTTIAALPGSPLKVIADRLRISEHTLRNHLSAIYQKLGVGNRLGLFDFAHRNALVTGGNRS